jgi:cytochrome c oxidase subunit IV
MEFHDDYPHYEVMSNHDEEYGKKARRKLWNVFWLMLIVTIAELIVGFIAPSKGWSGTLALKVFFISFTLVKAGAIVWWFMHLGHEVKPFKYTILLPPINGRNLCGRKRTFCKTGSHFQKTTGRVKTPPWPP